VPFRCTSCTWKLAAQIQSHSVDPDTGERTEDDPEELIGDGDDLPPCPDCGADTEHYTDNEDHDGAD
jgi:predicted RNA-binding Zn-ribbon protein involved in translation (DUF1610 family)